MNGTGFIYMEGSYPCKQDIGGVSWGSEYWGLCQAEIGSRPK